MKIRLVLVIMAAAVNWFGHEIVNFDLVMKRLHEIAHDLGRSTHGRVIGDASFSI